MSLYPTNTTTQAIADVITTGTPYLSLYTSSPTPNGTGTEVTGGAYARQAITFGSLSNGSVSNTVAVTFAGLPAGTITHFAIMDASTGGNMRAYGAINSSIATVSGDQVDFGIGNVKVTVSGS